MSAPDPRELERLPWRGPGPDRPELPLPPGSQPLLGPGRRLRKRWRYVGVFCEEFMICAARVLVGPFGQTFWALLDRSDGRIREGTRKRAPFARGEVWSELPGGDAWTVGSDQAGVVTRIESRELRARLRIGEGRWAESICPNGEGRGGYVWTRKRVTPIECRIDLADGRRIERSAYGIEDESAGYHPRRTVWRWSAGVGTAADGRAVGWNLVSGVNDPVASSERTIWIDGEPSEPGPVSFEDELTSVSFEDGSRLSFRAEAERRASERFGPLRSEYRQPFGAFGGALGGLELSEGWGVMEHHEALW